jgi:tol-pal system-associated acyl-CoA thioesterase
MQPFTSCYRVYYEDTDAGGIMYHANYLKFAERARTDLLRSLNIEQVKLAQTAQVILVVSNCQIDYKQAAKLDDEVLVETKINKLGKSYIDFNQQMIHKTSQELLTIIQVKVACVDAISKHPTKLPRVVSDQLLAIINL